MTPEALLEKAERALASAQLLYAHGDYEGACNRAYYAMFDAAKSALTQISPDVGISASRTHNGLITAFGLHLVKSGKIEAQYGKSLNRAQTLRQLADYTGEPISAESVQAMIHDADLFLQKIASKLR